MSYYLGQSAIPVKPVTRRTTFTRGFQQGIRRAYLQTNGRCPANRRGYPVAGIPVATMRPFARGIQTAFSRGPSIPFGRGVENWFRGTAMSGYTGVDLSREPGQDQLGAYPPAPLSISVRTRSGRLVTTNPYEGGAFITSTIGADAPAGYGLAPLSMLQSTPSIPSVVAAPAPSSVWNPITSLLNLWDARPQALKDIRLSVNPNQAMQALQTVVKPGQISGAVDQLRRWGINPSYQGVPVTGPMAGYGYQFAGIDWMRYVPWAIGGGLAFLILPQLLGKKR